MRARFDHLVISVADLRGAVASWGAAGMGPQLGGRHPGGTVNALVRGPRAAYIELISTESDPGGADSALAERVREATGPLGFAIAVDDLDAARAALTAAEFDPREITDGSRTTPDGAVLRWRLCQVGQQAFDPHLPFLIEWLEPMPPGPGGGPTVESLTVATPHRDRLATMLRTIGFEESTVDDAGSSFTDGEVRITLADEPGRVGPAAVTVGVPAGAPSRFELDGLRVTTTPARR